MLAVGTEITVTARERVARLSLSMVEAMSHVLIAALARGEVDYILCYDVPDSPGVQRTALLQDDLVLVTPPRARAGQPVPLSEVLEEPLAMPEPGDSVRTAVARAASDLGLRLQVAFEVRSIPAMKSLIQRGVASSILPFASVLEEVRQGTLQVRPIVMPSVRRTLFLARAVQAGPFRHAAAFRAIIEAAMRSLLSELGPLGHRIAGAA
jgi:LysR family nitrogen assimilation transcriptional regulator